MKSKPILDELSIFVTASEAIALKQVLDKEYISHEIPGARQIVDRIIKFANEQLANRSS